MENKENVLIPQSAVDVSYTARIKIYPDGNCSILCADVPFFRESGWESSDKPDRKTRGGHDVERSIRRARSKLRDIALSSNFKYFVTLTLDKEKIDRYDTTVIIKKLQTWLDNNVRRRGLSYALVPERHQDGAIHFHGFFNDSLPVVFSGHYDENGHEIYNLPRWGFGFSTAISLYGDYSRAVGYVCKYIGKQTEKIGGRWYYSGGDLGSPDVIYSDLNYSDIFSVEGAYSFAVEGVSARFVVLNIPLEACGKLCGKLPRDASYI